jgi:hypothetical protein
MQNVDLGSLVVILAHLLTYNSDMHGVNFKAWFSLIGDVLRSIACEQRRRKCTNILCINDHRQWASPMFTINENQAQVAEAEYTHSCRAVRTFFKMSINLYKFYHFFAHLCSDKISLE